MTARNKTGQYFANLINTGLVPLDSFCAGLEDVLRQAEDFTIDIPKIWEGLAEILGACYVFDYLDC